VNQPTISSKLDLQEIFPFALDDFQLQAIAALNNDQSVVVCAPTGSGKTLVGEYAIYRALSRGKRVFYTTPLKALSNQKFRDFQGQFGEDKVGLVTGDELENPEADIVVMTTEIFRNMLYETPIGHVGTSLINLETVVLDECHYISDRGRGTVWEESIIYCPPTIQLVGLSATIGNPEELTDWINQVRTAACQKLGIKPPICQLINSNFRPVPLRYYFSNNNGLVPLLNSKQNKLNATLKPQTRAGNQAKGNRKDIPTLLTTINQLREKDMLPAIYVIFSRRGCDQAVENLDSIDLVTDSEAEQIRLKLLNFFLTDNLELQQKLITFFEDYPHFQQLLLDFIAINENAEKNLCQFLRENPPFIIDLFLFLSTNSNRSRVGQVEPLLRGIAAHHAGILPAWKKLVEELFEAGLIKVVFATATLAAGINMPARTTVISALSKRSDDGHRLLTPAEFFQIAGRAGRRGMDQVGHVVMLQTRFEGAVEAAYLATADVEPLRSWFTPSYGMVLNLLQKHSIEEIKELLKRSFAEYLAELKLVPEEQAISNITSELAKLDVELAAIDIKDFSSYEKLRETLKEEYRLLEILQQQAEMKRKREISPLLPKLQEGQIISLKGKHIRVTTPIITVIYAKIPGSGQSLDLLCFGVDNRWYIATNGDIADIIRGKLSTAELAKLTLPEAEILKPGKWRKGDSNGLEVAKIILQNAQLNPVPSEILAQEEKVKLVTKMLEDHPLQNQKNPNHLIKRHKLRLQLEEKLHRSQVKYRQHQITKSYYWQDFLNLIEVLRYFGALDGYQPTILGEAAAAVRGENELWLGLTLMSGELEELEPRYLAAVISALITETPRPDSWSEYPRSPEVLEVLAKLQKTKQELIKVQRRQEIALPAWLERDFVGLVEMWALGEEFGVQWSELCENTSLDEGDIVRMLRRTIDVLWQIPQVPHLSETLKNKAKQAIALMKRFPI
jgi:superfamily II RNA helicase